jgi:hypothetical protein
MQISKSTRLYKLFAWSIRLITAFSGGGYERRNSITSGTDLCHFIRTLLITGHRINVNRDATVHVLTAFGDYLIPLEDLNPSRNQTLRTELASTVSKLWQDRSELIDDLLSQLKNL